MEKVFFSENQMTKSIWIWLLLFLLLAIFVYATVAQVFLGQPFGDQSAPDYILIFNGLLIIMFFWIFINMKLITEVRKDGWYYKFRPFHKKWRFIKWEEIDKAEVRKYKPIDEYGGWGIRSLFGKGKAFSMRGRSGLQLTLKNKQKVLFGTQKSAELEKAIEIIMNS